VFKKVFAIACKRYLTFFVPLRKTLLELLHQVDTYVIEYTIKSVIMHKNILLIDVIANN
jgi:hypothetical protein